MSKFQIPTEENFRSHLGFLLTFCLSCFALQERYKIPEFELEKAIDLSQLIAFRKKLLDADSNRIIPISEKEMLFTYAIFYVSNLLFVSSYDELIYRNIVVAIPYFDPNINFEGLRKNIVY